MHTFSFCFNIKLISAWSTINFFIVLHKNLYHQDFVLTNFKKKEKLKKMFSNTTTKSNPNKEFGINERKTIYYNFKQKND